jgi:small subunit ribosomal protein S17
MADEPDNETTETETPAAAAPEAGTPEAEAGTPEVGTSAPESAPVAQETSPAAEAPAEEQAPAAEAQSPEPAAEVAEADEVPPVAPVAAPAEPVEQVSPKERRRRARSTHSEAKPQRTPQERHDERLAVRKDKAVRRRARRLQERAKAAERRKSSPAQEPLPPVHAQTEGTRKVRQGIVVSNKADKTITVRIDTARRHRRYEKIVRSSSTLHAHDENNEAHEGDVVRVVESRPLSRSKRWRLVDVLEKAR